MESDAEGNPDEQNYILSLLRNLKSPNRFADGNPSSCPSVISEGTDISTFGDDSDSNDSISSLSSNGEDNSDRQLVENFNRVKTGHKLDDYILTVLKSGQCPKKSSKRNHGISNKLFSCPEVTLDVGENISSPGSVEVSDILSRHHGLASHKLDDVLHRAKKMVKRPQKKKTYKFPDSKEPVKSSSTKMDQSAVQFTCPECNFVFYSEESRNRHISNEHTKRITRMRNRRKCRKSTKTLQNFTSKNDTTSTCSTAESTINSDVDPYTSTFNSNAVLKVNGHLLQEFEEGQFLMGKFKDLCNAKDKSFGKGVSLSVMSPCKRVIISHGVGDEGQCSRTKPFLEQMKQVVDNHCTRDDSNVSMIMSSTSGHSSTSSNQQLSTLSIHRSSTSGFIQQTSSSSSSSETPAVLTPHTEHVLKEKHWIILDMPDVFSSSSNKLRMEQENLTRNNETFGIKSIDDSNKTCYVIQHFEGSQEDPNASQDTIRSSGDSERCAESTSDHVKNSPIMVHCTTEKESYPSDLSNTQDKFTKNISYEPDLNLSHACARHLSFAEYIKRYTHFKTMTEEMASLSPKKQKECTMDSVHTHETSKQKEYISLNIKDFILSPPKKRWKCYVADDF